MSGMKRRMTAVADFHRGALVGGGAAHTTRDGGQADRDLAEESPDAHRIQDHGGHDHQGEEVDIHEGLTDPCRG